MQEEPEILGLSAAHYRALLRLRCLDARQRDRLTGLLAQCEAAQVRAAADMRGAGMATGLFPGSFGANAHGPLDVVAHENAGCLTAIRLYAAGALHALAKGNPDMARDALRKIDAQVARCHHLLATSPPPNVRAEQVPRFDCAAYG